MQNNIYGVIGNPIAHSKSPIIHNLWYERLNINANYEKILVENPNDLKNTILKYKGVNVTLPYKEEVAILANYKDEGVINTKAANTIINDNGTLKAYNTDIFGFYEPIKNYKINNALIIGAGGAARAVYYSLAKNNIKTKVINRSKKDDFLCEVHTILDEFEFDLIINSTSASLKNLLPLEENLLEKLAKNTKIAYDLAYNHDIFLDFCKLKNPNIITQDGLDMLIFQAALAFEYFCGIYPNEDLINEARELIK
ncbi:shikimate dehydrogenase [Campylobacter sp. RM12642]|uniref:shikimate dehydrogenase n=1 Tax=Campylobacter sp. RM12642 TaxID=2735736 RepID=UPI0030147C2B|nr:shikimate dehydrogenase [Campylobacter sp. RM12642]